MWGLRPPPKGDRMVFDTEDINILHSLYYNFANFEVRLGRDPKIMDAEQWQINAPNRHRTWLTGQGTSITAAYNNLMRRMVETDHFPREEWLGAGS